MYEPPGPCMCHIWATWAMCKPHTIHIWAAWATYVPHMGHLWAKYLNKKSQFFSLLPTCTIIYFSILVPGTHIFCVFFFNPYQFLHFLFLANWLNYQHNFRSEERKVKLVIGLKKDGEKIVYNIINGRTRVLEVELINSNICTTIIKHFFFQC